MHDFLSARCVDGLEWTEGNTYGRTFRYKGARGAFSAAHVADAHRFDVDVQIDDTSVLPAVVRNIRRIFDLDADQEAIRAALRRALGDDFPLHADVRLPGIWDLYEAGIRAILGQQISVKAAHRYCGQLVEALGEPLEDRRLFPTPDAVAQSDLAFFRMPGAKKDTLRRFSEYMADDVNDHRPQAWIQLKGIGPWTVQYARMRGKSDPDIYLVGDLGVIKMREKLSGRFSPRYALPWRSYLTIHLWKQL